MISENDVIKAIVECANEKGECDPQDVINYLRVGALDLLPIFRSLKRKGYIGEDLTFLYVTEETLKIYNLITH